MAPLLSFPTIRSRFALALLELSCWHGLLQHVTVQHERAKRAGSQQDIIIENVISSVRFVSVCNERLHYAVI